MVTNLRRRRQAEERVAKVNVLAKAVQVGDTLEPDARGLGRAPPTAIAKPKLEAAWSALLDGNVTEAPVDDVERLPMSSDRLPLKHRTDHGDAEVFRLAFEFDQHHFTNLKVHHFIDVRFRSERDGTIVWRNDGASAAPWGPVVNRPGHVSVATKSK